MSTILPPLGVWLAWRYRRNLRVATVVLAALAAPVLLTSLPWTWSVREAGLGTIWVTDGAGVWYYMGHNDDAYELFCKDPTPERRRTLLHFPGEEQFTMRPDYQRARAAPMPERQRVFWRTALDWDRSHLYAQPCLAGRKFYDYWRPWVNPDAYSFQTFLLSLGSVPVLLFGLFGTALAWRRGERTATIYMWILTATGTATAVICSTEIRYRIPIVDVVLLAFTGGPIDELMALVRSRRRNGAA